MTVESVTYISDLNATYPAAGDNPNEGDDHLRNLKSGLKNTFPNVTGAVTVTHTELNYLSGVTSNIQTQLNSLGGTMKTIQTGTIQVGVAGSGTTATASLTTAVTTSKAYVAHAGVSGVSTACNVRLELTNGSTVTAIFSTAATGTVTVGYAVIEYN